MAALSRSPDRLLLLLRVEQVPRPTIPLCPVRL